jgi:exosome complex RNA-binding protein Csl4
MAKKNFTISTVAVAPDPTTSGTSLDVASGDGSLFATSEPALIFPNGEQPDSSNAEIVTVSNVATDTLTIVREQESTTARDIQVGDIILQQISAKDWNDLINKFPTGDVVGTTDTQTLTNKTINTADNTLTITYDG